MGHNLEGSRIKVRVKDSYSVGYVARSISIRIVPRIRVVSLISIVHKKHRQLGMLDKELHRSMQHWIIGRHITRHLLSRWAVSFVIKLFIF